MSFLSDRMNLAFQYFKLKVACAYLSSGGIFYVIFEIMRSKQSSGKVSVLKVFAENESGSEQKNMYNEKTLKFKKTVTVSQKYPFPYGFILGTTGGDGDNLDCFIITKENLKRDKLLNASQLALWSKLRTIKKITTYWLNCRGKK